MPDNYNIWKLWDNRDDINGQIAHEIDIIQTLFQLLTYYRQYPERFERADMIRWLNERHEIRSTPGTHIFRNVIAENRYFQEIFAWLGISVT